MRPLGAALRAHRPRHRHRRPARELRRRDVGEIPARLLTDECPRYEVERTPRDGRPRPAQAVAQRAERGEQALDLPPVRPPRRLAHRAPPGAGRRRDTASVHARIAVSLQGPRLGERDGFRAGVEAVLGAALNVACAGGEPIGLTDCLNFGNPEKPEIAWELEQSIEGIAEAAAALGVPVVSGTCRSTTRRTGGRSRRRGRRLRRARARRPHNPGRLAGGRRRLRRCGRRHRRAGDLVRWLAQAAPRLSLAHDVGDGGPAPRSPRLRSGAASAPTWTYPRLRRVIVACAPERADAVGGGLEEIGVVGGTQLLGHELDELRRAWETFD